MKLDVCAKVLLDSVEYGEWTPVGRQARSRGARYPEATPRKDRRLNMRLLGKDLIGDPAPRNG
jgi:hypothetical protein